MYYRGVLALSSKQRHLLPSYHTTRSLPSSWIWWGFAGLVTSADNDSLKCLSQAQAERCIAPPVTDGVQTMLLCAAVCTQRMNEAGSGV